MKPTTDPAGSIAWRPTMRPEQQTLTDLLSLVRGDFYGTDDRLAAYYIQKRDLARALTWPALWLERHNLHCSQQRYRSLLASRLAAIREHGDPDRYSEYFPRYLLKCLQDWFAWHGEEVTAELRHARNAIELALIGILTHADREECSEVNEHIQARRQIESLAQTHRILALIAGRRRSTTTCANQISLNLS